MADTIVYLAISKGGGIDGMDRSPGGNVTAAFLTREAAEKDPNKPWNDIKAEVFDLDKVAKEAWAKLSPVERIAMEQEFGRPFGKKKGMR